MIVVDLCVIDDCSKPVRVQRFGWCSTHYSRYRRHGDPLARVRHIVGTVEERVWFHTDRRGPDECWEWLGHKRDGYGRLRVGDRLVPAYRLTYELLVGPIPEGLEPDHLCRNTGCVNPSHLEPVPHVINVRRGRAGAHMKARTHCPWDHEYTPENTYVYRGLRSCRTCGSYAGKKLRKALIAASGGGDRRSPST